MSIQYGDVPAGGQVNIPHQTNNSNIIGPTLVNVSAQSRDRANLLCNVRPTIYDGVDNVRPTIYDGVDGVKGNDSVNLINHSDNIPAKAGYYNQNEHTGNYHRPLSTIQEGQSSSNIDYHGYLLF